MAYNKELTNRIREALVDVANIEEKRMFRGVAFMVDGKMCISAGDDTIMCRIDPALHDEAVEKTGCTTVIMRGRPYKGYVHVNGEGIKSKADFDYWIKLALDFNSKAKASPKKKKINKEKD
jgi:TfoX/Sxy family transcriptional regulator of competence genes